MAGTLTARRTETAPACDGKLAVTRSLLGYGIVAGPLYLAVTLVQALTRNGFSLARHDASLLANGAFGWIQSVNLVLTGVMVVAGAVGVRRRLAPGTGAKWAPRLLAGYGAGLIGAGLFRADPAYGFPAGAPAGPPGIVTWHAALHLVFGAAGFLCLIAACLVLARRFAAEGRRGWAVYSAVTGVVFLAGFLGVATGSADPVVVVGFGVAVVAAFAWLSAVCLSLYRAPDGEG